MKLSLFTDIGLRALMRLAGNPEQSFSTGELASELQISRHHLTKVVRRLSKAGYVISRRGNRGGIELALDADQIKIGDVVAELEIDSSLVECFRADGGACTLSAACKLSGSLARAKHHFIDELNQTTLRDIAYRI